MSYSLATLWHERNRYLAGVLTVAFSAVLMVTQWGLLLGIFSQVSTPIDRSRADIWVGYPGVPSIDVAPPIPEAWETRLANQPGVERVESYLEGFVLWGKHQGGAEIATVIGTRLDEKSLGAIRDLGPELRLLLNEPGSIIVDESALGDLGLKGIGDVGEVNGNRVRLVGTVRGVKGIAGAYLFCSIPTARKLLHIPRDRVTYFLVQCRDPAEVPAVVEGLRAYPDLSAFSRQEFTLCSRLHWLTKTKAGLALGCAALLGLIVGAAVIGQMLYAATAALLRQYAVLEALGIPAWRMGAMVLAQSFWVGLLGLGLAVPLILGLSQLVNILGARMLLPIWLVCGAAVLTMAMALLSGLFALRSLRLVEPTALLR